MLDLFLTAFKFLLSISLIVSIHELGHLLFAKLFGMRVEEYMVGMPPRLISFKRRETRYGIGAIPLGGYVKITGMGIDPAQKKEEEIKNSYQNQAAWKKFCVLLGGIFFNFLTASLLFSIIFSTIGQDYIPYEEQLAQGIRPSELGKTLGFKEGDRIISLNGKKFDKTTDFHEQLSAKRDNIYLLKDTDMRERELVLSSESVQKLIRDKKKLFQIRVPYKIKKVIKGSLAARIGLKPGDKLLRIAGVSVHYLQDLEKFLRKNPKPQNGELAWTRSGKSYEATLLCQGEQQYGIAFEPILKLKKERIKNPLVSLAKGVKKSGSFLSQQLYQMQLLLRGETSIRSSIKGPIGIATLFSEVSSLELLLFLIALLSLMVGFMNLLPIPGLDGFHATLLLIELMRRQPFKRETQLKIQQFTSFFFIILISLICLNDLVKIFL